MSLNDENLKTIELDHIYSLIKEEHGERVLIAYQTYEKLSKIKAKWPMRRQSKLPSAQEKFHRRDLIRYRLLAGWRAAKFDLSEPEIEDDLILSVRAFFEQLLNISKLEAEYIKRYPDFEPQVIESMTVFKNLEEEFENWLRLAEN